MSDEETGRNMELFSFFSAPRIIVDLFRGESLTGSNLFDPLFHTAERIVTESIDASTYPPLVVRHSPLFPFRLSDAWANEKTVQTRKASYIRLVT